MKNNKPPVDPDEINIVDVETLDELREYYGFSKNEFSREAGFGHEDRWGEIVREGRQPRLDTYQAFVNVIKNADPDGARTQRGRTPNCQIRSDGGNRGDEL